MGRNRRFEFSIKLLKIQISSFFLLIWHLFIFVVNFGSPKTRIMSSFQLIRHFLKFYDMHNGPNGPKWGPKRDLISVLRDYYLQRPREVAH